MVKILYPPAYHELLAPSLISAELYRGTLVRCGPGVRGLGWPDTPHVRASVLKQFNVSDLVFILRTAAWVWGGEWQKEENFELSTFRGVRYANFLAFNYTVREFNILPSDALNFNGVLVTNPLRTVLDLLLMPDKDYKLVDARNIAYICKKYDIKLELIILRLTGKRRPYSNIALKRARQILSLQITMQ